jgi:single-strand DNA-binding protein
MSGLNKVMLIGNVGTDPEMRFTANGNAMTTFRLAISRVHNTVDGERKQETDWFTIVTWGKVAESCNQFLTKGRKVYVEASLRSKIDIIANRVMFLDRQTAATLPAEEAPVEFTDEIDPDEIPFNT